MKEEVLKEIEKIGLEEVTTRLLAFARALLKKRYWRTGKASGPNGEEPEDFVYGAITKALTDWNWNKDKYPNVMGYLKSRVYGLISNAITGGDNVHASSKDLHASDLGIHVSGPNIDLVLDEVALERHLDALIRSSVKGDDDRLPEVYDAMKLGYQSLEITELLDISIDVVRNYKKRVRYCLKDFKPSAK